MQTKGIEGDTYSGGKAGLMGNGGSTAQRGEYFILVDIEQGAGVLG